METIGGGFVAGCNVGFSLFFLFKIPFPNNQWLKEIRQLYPGRRSIRIVLFYDNLIIFTVKMVIDDLTIVVL